MSALSRRVLNPIMWLDPIFYHFTPLGRKQTQYNEEIDQFSDELVYLRERELSAKDDPTPNFMNFVMKDPYNSREKKCFDVSKSITNQK